MTLRTKNQWEPNDVLFKKFKLLRGKVIVKLNSELFHCNLRMKVLSSCKPIDRQQSVSSY